MVKKNFRDKSKSRKNYLLMHQIKIITDSINDMRDKFLIKILYETGCSVGELVNIRVSDIRENKIKILNNDTKNLRFSRISEKLANELQFFIKGNNLPKESFILTTKKSSKISEKRVRQLIQYYTHKSGFGKINPQMFRYYHIANAYQEGVSIENISSQLGIMRYRIFQILTDLEIVPKKNHYDNFFDNLEVKK